MMRRGRRLGLILVVSVVGCGTAGCSDGGTSFLRPSGGNRVTVGLNGPRVGQHVFMLEPDLVNQGKHVITLESVRVAHVPSGLREVGHRLYQPLDGAEITAWQPASGPHEDPEQLDPVAVRGYMLPPSSADPPRRMLMVEFEVLRPGTYRAGDVVVRYRARGHAHEQTFEWGFEVKDAQP